MDQNGERVEYTATNIAHLDRYIASLKPILPACLALASR
jgi:hypothetical protein